MITISSDHTIEYIKKNKGSRKSVLLLHAGLEFM